MAVNDGDTITLGGTALKLYVIPGHTLGTLATVFTVHDRGEPHRAVAWGGTAYNFGPLPDRLQLYSDTTVKYREVMKNERPTSSSLKPHRFRRTVRKMEALKRARAANPILRGRPGRGAALPDHSGRMRAGDQGQHR